jgi:hypothetical protein
MPIKMRLKRLSAATISLLLLSAPAHAYYGLYSTEAWLDFDSSVDAKVDFESLPSVDTLNQDGSPERTAALGRVEEQVRHLIGVLQSDTLKRDFGYQGALSEDDHEVRFTEISPGSRKGRVHLSYSIHTKAVFDKRVFGSGQESVEFPYVKLPLQPDRVYRATFTSDGKNHCTDPDWQDRDDFWYFFDPDKEKCPLRGNTTDVVRTSGVLTRIENTHLTYPQYDRLFGDNGDGELLKIAIFYGYIDDVKLDVVKRSDDGYRNMRKFEEELPGMGFVLDESRSQNKFRVREDGRITTGINYLHFWHKAFPSRDWTKREIEIQILLSDTDASSRDATFHTYLKPALETTDLLVYDGHVGTPENLDLNMRALQGLKMDPTKYQIFFLNGCSTYPYYKNMYFGAKGGAEAGKKNLELITSGLEVPTDVSLANMKTFLGAFVSAKTLSNQAILQDLDHSNGTSGTFLFGVNGDEASDWRP